MGTCREQQVSGARVNALSKNPSTRWKIKKVVDDKNRSRVVKKLVLKSERFRVSPYGSLRWSAWPRLCTVHICKKKEKKFVDFFLHFFIGEKNKERARMFVREITSFDVDSKDDSKDLKRILGLLFWGSAEASGLMFIRG